MEEGSQQGTMSTTQFQMCMDNGHKNCIEMKSVMNFQLIGEQRETDHISFKFFNDTLQVPVSDHMEFYICDSDQAFNPLPI